MKIDKINGTKTCPVMLTLVTVRFFVCIGLHERLIAILCPYKSLATPLLLLSSFPPTAYYDGARITNVPQDEHTRFPALNLSVSEDDKQHDDCYREEAHVTEERDGVDPEWTDDAHGTDNARHDEGGCTKELAYGQATRICTHSGESSKHVWACVPKCEECYTGHVFVEPKELGNGGEIRCEKIGGRYAEGGEEEEEP